MEATISRQGIRTSEFWLILLFFAVVVLNGTSFVTLPGEDIALLATLTFGYGGGRTVLKNALAKTALTKNGATS